MEITAWDCVFMDLATLLTENIAIKWFTTKHLYRHQKHVSESMRAEDMLKSVYLATLVVESGNPVCPTLARMSPFDCPPQKTYV